ncbi:MAG TPA: GNAT family N-acetyltransferase [Actinospica sp.]|jgi:GNAT superfamily N-acetyltransferase|nr:GNAT family N-acetyltransferase [Actinospica sp.]
MRIERLNPVGEPADLTAITPVTREFFAEVYPGFPPPGENRMRFWASDGYHTRNPTYAVYPDEPDSAPLALLGLGLQDDGNLDLVNAFLVLPVARRDDGTGAFLLREALRLAAEHGRSRLVIDAASTTDPTPFFTAAGGRHVFTGTRSVLDLTEVDPGKYEAWAAGSAKNAGYRFVRWVDRCPDELAESYCTAMDAMRDAPLEDMKFEHPKADLERLRGREEHSAGYGIRRHVLAAVDAEGNVAGFNIFAATPDEPQSIDIWDTAVIGEHRGHGLGLRIKAAATLWMREEYPQARWVETFNNHGNEHMLNVNLTMGYRKYENWLAFEFATGA